MSAKPCRKDSESELVEEPQFKGVIGALWLSDSRAWRGAKVQDVQKKVEGKERRTVSQLLRKRFVLPLVGRKAAHEAQAAVRCLWPPPRRRVDDKSSARKPELTSAPRRGSRRCIVIINRAFKFIICVIFDSLSPRCLN